MVLLCTPLVIIHTCVGVSAQPRDASFLLAWVMCLSGGLVMTLVLSGGEGDGDEGLRRIGASRLRFNLQPLMTQRDFVNSYYYIKVVTDQVRYISVV